MHVDVEGAVRANACAHTVLGDEGHVLLHVGRQRRRHRLAQEVRVEQRLDLHDVVVDVALVLDKVLRDLQQIGSPTTVDNPPTRRRVTAPLS